MNLDPTKNFSKVIVSTGYDASATTVVLSSGEGAKLPQPSTDGAFNLVWHNVSDYPDPSNDPNVEIVRVTARTADTLTIVRAQEDTTAKTHNTSAKTYQMILGLTSKMVTDIETEIDGKLNKNTAITGATKTKITYDANGLITAGADATTADIADSTDKRYVTDAEKTKLGNLSGTNTGDNATNSQYSGLATSKQDTLVSGTNIKTINSESLLGSGDIVISSGGYTVATQTAATRNETATSGELVILCDTTSNSITINLPTAVGNTAKFHIKKTIAANSVTIDGYSSETIDGDATLNISNQWDSITLISNNINWLII